MNKELRWLLILLAADVVLRDVRLADNHQVSELFNAS